MLSSLIYLMVYNKLYFLVISFFLFKNCISIQLPIPKKRQIENVSIHNGYSLKYLFYKPTGYYENTSKKRPLLIFLHGKGERGNDFSLLKTQGIPKMIENKIEFPFFVLSPQITVEENEEKA